MKKIIAANWKMQKTNKEAEEFFKKFKKLIKPTKTQIVFCVPYTTIPTAVKHSKELSFSVGAENVAWAKSGTFTGEISADMLIEAGVHTVIIGHSERRQMFGETLDSMNARLKAALESGLTAIVCINETLEELESGKTSHSIKNQIETCLRGISDIKNLVLAYEPVFAISGGDPNKPKPIPTREKIESVHGLMKQVTKAIFPKIDVPVLYGGSANDKNIDDLYTMKNVDGALVGGASLDPVKFAYMCNAEVKK